MTEPTDITTALTLGGVSPPSSLPTYDPDNPTEMQEMLAYICIKNIQARVSNSVTFTSSDASDAKTLFNMFTDGSAQEYLQLITAALTALSTVLSEMNDILDTISGNTGEIGDTSIQIITSPDNQVVEYGGV